VREECVSRAKGKEGRAAAAATAVAATAAVVAAAGKFASATDA